MEWPVFGKSLPNGAGIPGVKVHDLRTVHIRLLQLMDCVGGLWVKYRQRDLENQPKSARVQVQRTKQAEFFIDRDTFGVQQASLELQDLHTCGQ